MPRHSRSVALGRELEDEIDALGDRRRLPALYRGLRTLLEVGVPSDTLARCSTTASRRHAQLLRHIREDTGYALPKAVYAVSHHRVRLETAARTWRVRQSELRYVQKLARHCGADLGDTRPSDVDAVTTWQAEVDEWHDELDVYVSAAAFDDMILTALEAYTVPNRRGLPTEVYGLCFGTERSEEGKLRAVGPYHRRIVTIERVAPQLRARANHDYVVPNEHATDVQLDVMHELFPNLTPVGDFHSHPYKRRRQVLRAAGWSFSDQDERSNRRWVEDMLKRGHRPRLALIVAIARARRAGKPHYSARNVFCRSVAGVHLWLSAYRIKTDQNYSAALVWLHAPGVPNRLP